jgi:hypothetical protein
MNSTYLECVDRFFKYRGVGSAGSITLIFAFLYTIFFILSDLFTRDELTRTHIIASTIFTAWFLLLAFLAWFLVLRYEFRRHTHYPMRFNRKNRMVYVTRTDGTVMAEPWDKLVFCLMDKNPKRPTGWCEICGHKIAADGWTVLETFPLAQYGHKDDELMYGQWEFIRRYMEDGPQEFMKEISDVMDVADRKERFWHGYARLAAEDAAEGWGIILFPVFFWHALGRWVAMHSSKTPVWPQEVEAQCKIEPNDPYIRDAAHLADLGAGKGPPRRRFER